MEESFLEQAKLNPKQKEAVRTTEGALLILAGAGSGKTRVLTHRIAHLILDKGVNPWNILAITFTNKAAREMKERVQASCGDKGNDVWVSTFHALCVRILRREIEALSYSREFTIYDDEDQLKVISALVEENGLSVKEFPPKEIRAVIADAKNAMRPPKKQRETAVSKREEIFADIYESYEKKLHANNALDFDDLILKTTVLFDKFPDVCEKYARRFRYIHVDEYQDTNIAQYVLIRALASVWGNICVVGDDDQSIYGWRGADIRNILEFEKDFTDAVTIKLEQNYRSTNCILSAANAVIAHNSARKKKTLWSDNGDGAPVRVEELADGRGEAAFVVSEILNAAKEGKPYSEFAVLYRTNNQSRIMEEMLLGSGIPYRVYGGQPFYGRKEVRDAIAYLRLIVNPADELALRRVLNVPKRGLGDSALSELLALAQSSGDSMLGVILDHASHPLSGRIRGRIAAFSALMDDLITNSMLMKPNEFIDYLLDKTGLRAMYRDEKSDEAKDRLDNLEELNDAAGTYFDDNPEASLQDYLTNVALVSEPEEQDLFPSSRGAVTLMTLHSAKGLEFGTVFMIGMEEGLFPLSRTVDDPEEIEEERRLCYVGMTRAKKQLYMTHADTRFQYGETRANAASRFLEEVPEKLTESLLPKPIPHRNTSYSWDEDDWETSFSGWDNAPKKTEKKPNMGTTVYTSAPKKSDAAAQEWSLAMRVRHRRFGLGRVIAVSGSGAQTLLSVAFENNGVKNLVAAQANLEVVED